MALVLGLASAGRAVPAQEAFGTLQSETLGAPLPGVLITVSLARNDSTIIRTTTNARGAYRVWTGTEPVILRALRVGQRPSELGRVTLHAGERRELGGALPDRPVAMAPVSSRVDRRCRQDPVDGSLVAQLFSDARTALWASQVAAESVEATAVVRQVVHRLDTRGQPDGESVVAEDTSSTLRAFRANDVRTLLDRGFLDVRPDQSMIWSAPDAELLTDDRFLASYCLRLAPTSASPPDEIGVVFEPVRDRRGVVQLRGTLWLDRRSHALRRIEYGYRNVEPTMARTTPGGYVEYTRLDNGVWFVSEWAVRMPRVGNIVMRTRWQGDFEHVTVLGVQVTSGYVQSLAIDRVPVFTAGLDAKALLSDATPVDRARLVEATSCAPSAADTLATARGVVRGPDGEAMAGVLVTARWTEHFAAGEVRLSDRVNVALPRDAVTRSNEAGEFVLCHLPRRTAITLIAGAADAPTARMTLRIPREMRETRVTLDIRTPSAPW